MRTGVCLTFLTSTLCSFVHQRPQRYGVPLLVSVRWAATSRSSCSGGASRKRKPEKRTQAIATVSTGTPSSRRSRRQTSTLEGEADHQPLPSTSSSSTRTHPLLHVSAQNEPVRARSIKNVSSKTEAAEETEMSENDTRLAMRLLMSRHLTRERVRHRPQKHALDDLRENMRIKQQETLRRIEQKNRNSLQLLGADAFPVLEGVLPLFTQSTPGETGDAGEKAKKSGGGGGAAWMQPNRVEFDGASMATTTTIIGDTVGLSRNCADASISAAAAEWPAVSLETLCRPDLSVYSNERDVRIDSHEMVTRKKEGVQEERDSVHSGRGRIAIAAERGLQDDGEAIEEALDENLYDEGGGAGMAQRLREQLVEEDEDQDFSVLQYGDSDGEELL